MSRSYVAPATEAQAQAFIQDNPTRDCAIYYYHGQMRVEYDNWCDDENMTNYSALQPIRA